MITAAIRPTFAHPAPKAVEAPPRDTPYQHIKNSPVGRFVRDNKVVSGIAGVGGSIVVAGAAWQSPAFAKVAEYGIVPAAAAGVAIVGAAAVHDAVVNDIGKHNGRAIGKILAGSTAALGGTQVIGDVYHIPVLDRALSGTVQKVLENGEGLAGAAVVASGLAAGKFAVNRFQAAATQKEHRAANVLIGTTSAAASAGGVLGGLELIGRQYSISGLDHVFSGTIEALSRTGMGSVVGGGFLVAGSGVLAQEAVQNFRKGGNDLLTVAEGMGAVSTGLGGAELLGHGLGIPALDGLFTQHLGAIGAAALTSTGAALSRGAVDSVRKNGLTVGNTLSGTTGASMTVGGLALGADTFGLHAAASALGHGTAVAAGLGLGAVTLALGRSAVNSFRKGDAVPGLAAAAGTTISGAASLGLVGEGLGIDAVTRLGEQVFDKAVVPIFDHVIEPAARFLFENPVAGAVVLAVGVGAYAYYRHKQAKP